MFLFNKLRTTKAKPSTKVFPERKSVIVNLWKMAGVGIIVPYPSGILYSNQSGGVACSHKKIEGFFLPLTTGKSNACPLANDLFNYFTGPKWRGSCWGGIDEADADFLNMLLVKYSPTSSLRVDREHLKSSEEAWIYVTVNFPESNSPLVSGFSITSAILTWPNSD